MKFDFPTNTIFTVGNSTLERFVTPFYVRLSHKNIKSFLFSVDNEAFEIKTNPFLEDNERLRQLDLYSGKAIDPSYFEKWISRSQAIIGKYWSELSPVSLKAFPIGLEHYHTHRLYNGNIHDASPPSIQFAKCIEIEIEQKLLLPFRDWFIDSEFKSMSLEDDLNDKEVSRIANFLIKPNSKAPELGTFAYFLSIVINSKKRAETSVTIKAYKEHTLAFEDSDFLISKEFHKTLNLITTKYRNGSAHTKALPFEYLEEFYRLLIGESQRGFLFKLLDALRKKEK